VGETSQEERSQRRMRLMVSLQNGDPEACRELLDDLGPAIMSFLRRRIADANEVEDVYQETFMALYQARHTYEPSRPLEPWLFAIARNVAADYTRRYWKRSSWQEVTKTFPDVAAESEMGSGSRLEKALQRLPKSQREAFTMLKLDGLTINEAAQRAGTNAGALKVRAHRAYQALKKIIGGSD
jgi:RNA polymerase sigma-70 factor (ECF subfamily)